MKPLLSPPRWTRILLCCGIFLPAICGQTGPAPPPAQTPFLLEALRPDPQLTTAILQMRPGDTTTLTALLKTTPKLKLPLLWEEAQTAARAVLLTDVPLALWRYQALRQIAETIGHPSFLAVSYYRLGVALAWLKRWPEAIIAYQQARSFCLAARQRAETAFFQREEAVILADLSYAQRAVEDFPAARTSAELALVRFSETRSLTGPTVLQPVEYGAAGAWATLWQLAVQANQHTTAVAAASHALTFSRSLADSNSLYRPQLVNELLEQSAWAIKSGRFSLAYNQLTEALNLAGDNEDQLGYIQHLFGVASAEEEDYERAATHFSLSLSLFRRQERHYEAAYTLLSLAVIEQRQGRYIPAAAGFQQVIQELQREAGANAPTPT